MTERQRIPITDPQHLIDMGVTLGFLTALEALNDVAMSDKLTGIGVAKHAIKAAEAEHRVRVMQRNIRLAVKHGIDLNNHQVVWQGNPWIEVEPQESPEGNSTKADP